MISFNDKSDGSIVISITAHIRPKGSGKAMIRHGTQHPIIIFDPPDYRKVSDNIHKALVAAWGERPPLGGPMRYSAIYSFVKPKTSKDPYPYHVGDIDKLMRRVLDWLGGNARSPGPVLANDNLIVATGQHQKVWSEHDGVVIKLTPMEMLRK